ncbi:hypothetical protein ACOME3_002054 [Neoechinorhynchus agilis]
MSNRNGRDRIIRSESVTRKVDYRRALRMQGVELGDIIGGGSYGKVRTCYVTQNSIGRQFWGNIESRMACKIIDKSRVPLNFVQKFLPRELEILRRVNHLKIVELRKILEIEHRVYIFTEFISGTDLLKFVQSEGPLGEPRAKRIYTQLADAIAYLHHNRIVHRDIKCENILINADTVEIKIIDFGFARYTYDREDGEDVESVTYCGSAAYAAPEILQGIPYKMRAYDIWSSGVVLVAILTGNLPFGDKNPTRILAKQRDGFSRNERMNNEVITGNINLRMFLEGVLEKRPSRRLTIDQVRAHRWLQP